MAAPRKTTSTLGPVVTSKALSATPLAAIGYFEPDPAQVIVAGGRQVIDFTGATIVQGDAYWGTAGTAQPLNVTVNSAGQLVCPDDDAVYDIDLGVNVLCGANDAGVMVGANVQGNDTGNSQGYAPVLGGEANVTVSGVLYVFKGDGPTPFGVIVDARLLTADAAFTVGQLHVTKR